MGKKKKHNNLNDNYWVGYKREGETIEIKVKDYTNRKLQKWEFNLKDSKEAGRVMKILKKSFGFNPEITPNDFAKKPNDLDWLK